MLVLPVKWEVIPNEKLYLIPLLIAFFLSIPFIAQETDAEGEPTTIQSLLQLVQEGRTTEQNENTKREQTFLAEKSKQASILAAEKRELARQERIADQLEAEYKKNEEILKVKEEAYKKELGSLVELLDTFKVQLVRQVHYFLNL